MNHNASQGGYGSSWTYVFNSREYKPTVNLAKPAAEVTVNVIIDKVIKQLCIGSGDG
jgi:hypothetical protein